MYGAELEWVICDQRWFSITIRKIVESARAGGAGVETAAASSAGACGTDATSLGAGASRGAEHAARTRARARLRGMLDCGCFIGARQGSGNDLAPTGSARAARS